MERVFGALRVPVELRDGCFAVLLDVTMLDFDLRAEEPPVVRADGLLVVVDGIVSLLRRVEKKSLSIAPNSGTPLNVRRCQESKVSAKAVSTCCGPSTCSADAAG